MYDIVDLEEDTIITSVNELCEVNNNKMLSKDSYEYSKNNFVDGSYYYCKENENDYYAVMRTPRFTTSNLYFKVWRDFDDKNRKKQEKKNPELEQSKKEKHAQQIKIILERLKSVIM